MNRVDVVELVVDLVDVDLDVGLVDVDLDVDLVDVNLHVHLVDVDLVVFPCPAAVLLLFGLLPPGCFFKVFCLWQFFWFLALGCM